MRFQQTDNQGLRQMLLTDEVSRGPLKGAMSAQKALQGSEMEKRELLGGTEESSVSSMRGH